MPDPDPDSESKTDIIIAIPHTADEDQMERIIARSKTYIFRKQLYDQSVRRVWCYETAPIKAITHICLIEPAHIRPPQPKMKPKPKAKANSNSRPSKKPKLELEPKKDTYTPLPENGIGNDLFNAYDPTFEGFDYAYKVVGCWRIPARITLDTMKDDYGIKAPPGRGGGVMYTPEGIKRDYKWDEQVCLWEE
ncbi:hypothetical protein IAT40_003855 [Kwoniella sp. CBS 6097]